MPRRDFSKVAFAATGDVNTIPSTVQPDGSVSLPSGWGFDYERDNGAGGGTPDPLAKNIDREDLNGILNEITASIGEIQQNGYAIWVSTAAPYPINAKVRRNNINYRSLITNNSDEPSVGAGSTSWAEDDALPAGRLLRTTIYRISGGVLQSSVDGGAFASASNIFSGQALTASVKVKVLGGGGGGGNAISTATGNVSGGGGGSAGGYCEKILTSGFNGLTITVGAGGAAQAAGSASSFGPSITASGGQAGTSGPQIPAVPNFFGGTTGGTATGGDINAVGGHGDPAFYAGIISGNGGRSILGAGGRFVSGVTTTGTPGQAAPTPGAGGSGAANGSAVAVNALGGVGAGGLVIVEEYSK